MADPSPVLATDQADSDHVDIDSDRVNSAQAAADHAGVKVPPPLLYVAGLGLGFLLQVLLPLGSWSEVAGILLALPCLALGIVLCAWAIGLFRSARTSLVPIVPSTTLVTSGPYRFTRNPMYVGLAFLYVGVALWFQLTWGLLLLAALLTLVYYLVIAREERYLTRKFGEAYVRYQGEVRRWL